MTAPTAIRLRQFASPHRPTAARRASRRAATLLLRLGCAALLAWIGAVHLHLWLEGYRQIPTDGPLFLLDAVTGLALAAVLLVWAAPLAGLVAVGYTGSTLGALLISLSVGLFGFHESISASFVTLSLVIETITVLALLTWTVLMAGTRQERPARFTARGDEPGRRLPRPGCRGQRRLPGGRKRLRRPCLTSWLDIQGSVKLACL